MAPPPPSQAGKFKPRKPVRKARTSDTTPISVPSSAAAAAGSNAPSAGASAPHHGGGRGGSGGRSGGRGGGRGSGRGRGRGPQPQGQVFFTASTGTGTKPGGTAKKTLASKARAAASAARNAPVGSSQQAAAAAARIKREEDSQEEVVGTMEEGVGSASQAVEAAKKAGKTKLEEGDQTETTDYYDTESKPSKSAAKKMASADTYTYDSDSSMEDVDAVRPPRKMQPLVLPFPDSAVAVGIGDAQERPLFYPGEGKHAATCPAPISSGGPISIEDSIRENPIDVSPFCNVTDKDALRAENDSWFLVQLPTRLPPVEPANVAHPDLQVEGVTEASVTRTSEVRNVAVQTHRFDNSLTTARPGRIGKMVVYKSGKTVLVLEGSDGAPTVQMNVTEGLTCGFRQQAVAIDANEAVFVPLGDVKKTIVVTPDLSGAFSA